MSLPSRTCSWILCAGLAACGGSPPSGGGAVATSAPAGTTAGTTAATPAGTTAATPSGTTEAPRGTSKPGAPVDLVLTARVVDSTAAGDRYELVLTATPRRTIDRLELAIDGRLVTAAAATAGGTSEARATVQLAHGAGKDVIATAVAFVDGRKLGVATQVRIGAPADEAPEGRILTLPDGTRVQEVRP
jgi:hypothetical protein